MPSYRLPFPPSVNHYWRRVGQRTLISRSGRAFRENVIASVFEQGRTKIVGRLAVTIEVYPPDRRRRDLDNLTKSTLDALAHAGVFDDDEQIDELRLRRHNCDEKKLGYIVVDIVSYPRNEDW